MSRGIKFSWINKWFYGRMAQTWLLFICEIWRQHNSSCEFNTLLVPSSTFGSIWLPLRSVWSNCSIALFWQMPTTEPVSFRCRQCSIPLYLPIFHDVRSKHIVHNVRRWNYIWNANQCECHDLKSAKFANFCVYRIQIAFGSYINTHFALLSFRSVAFKWAANTPWQHNLSFGFINKWMNNGHWS